MNNSTYKNELFLDARGALDVGPGSGDRRELEAVPGEKNISKPTTSVDVNREPDWIREFRKNAYRVFKSKPLPTHWAGDELKEIDFDRIRYYLASGEATKR